MRRLDLLLRKSLSASRAICIMMMLEDLFFQSSKIRSEPVGFLTAPSSQTFILSNPLLLVFDAPVVLVELRMFQVDCIPLLPPYSALMIPAGI